jgi:5-methylthioadenosine/S-adenosylhomocysteine deaminase
MALLFTDVYIYDAETPDGMTGPNDVLVLGNRICRIGAGARSEYGAHQAKSGEEHERVIAGDSKLLMVPGLINAHFHSSVNHLKGSIAGLPLEPFMLYESPASNDLLPTPREAYLRTLLGAIEMLRTGTTVVQDDAFLMPYPTPEVIDAVMTAYADCGIRASVALDHSDLPEIGKLPYLEQLVPEAMGRQLAAAPPADTSTLLEIYEYFVSKWHGAANGRLTAATSVSAPQRVSVSYFEALNELSRRHSIPIFAHVLETKVQRALAVENEERFGRSLVQYIADRGLLSDRMNMIHMVWADDQDLVLVAEARAVIAHNPVSNLRLGSGVAPYRRFLDHGIRVALGVDEAVADDSCNMWGVVKLAGLIHNISDPDGTRWPTAAEVLHSLWRGGAAALLRGSELGAVREGYIADLALVDLHSLAFTPLNDLRAQLVYCESGLDVKYTVVDGAIVFEEGALTRIDEEAVLDEARALFREKQAAVHRVRRQFDDVLPYYQAVVKEAARADLGIDRRVGRG